MNTERVLSDGHDPGPRRQVIAAIIALALLIGGGLWLTRALRGAAALQDCVSAGRTNCAPVGSLNVFSSRESVG